MDFKIKQLKKIEDLPFKQIGDLYNATYSEFYRDAGALNWEEKYAEWYFNAYHNPPDYYFTAWKGDELIATTLGTKCTVLLDDEIELIGVSIGLTATKPEYQRQGIQKKLIQALIDRAKSDGIDFLFSFPDTTHHGHKLLKEHFEFSRINKNAEHVIKIIGDHGRWVLQNYRGLSAVLAKLAVVYAGKPEAKLSSGKIRDGNLESDDVKKVLEMINSYSKRLPLSKVWKTEEDWIKEMTNAKKLSEYYPEWKVHWWVWETNNVILATITIRTELVTFNTGTSSVALVSTSCFKDGLTIEEKEGFLATVVRRFWNEDVEDTPESRKKNIFTVQTTQPQYEAKAFKKIKVTDDTTKYEFLILPLTEKAQEIQLRYKKINEFYIPYFR